MQLQTRSPAFSTAAGVFSNDLLPPVLTDESSATVVKQHLATADIRTNSNLDWDHLYRFVWLSELWGASPSSVVQVSRVSCVVAHRGGACRREPVQAKRRVGAMAVPQ